MLSTFPLLVAYDMIFFLVVPTNNNPLILQPVV
jgi:hypothetical protein